MPATSELASTRPNPRGMALLGDSLKATSGRSYYRARYYDPSSGRFFSEDPLKFFGGDTNLYRYVWNQSLSFRDPRGLWGAGVVGSAGAFGGLGGNVSAGGTVTVGGAYFPDASAPLGFTSGGFISAGAFAGGMVHLVARTNVHLLMSLLHQTGVVELASALASW